MKYKALVVTAVARIPASATAEATAYTLNKQLRQQLDEWSEGGCDLMEGVTYAVKTTKRKPVRKSRSVRK